MSPSTAIRPQRSHLRPCGGWGITAPYTAVVRARCGLLFHCLTAEQCQGGLSNRVRRAPDRCRAHSPERLWGGGILKEFPRLSTCPLRWGRATQTFLLEQYRYRSRSQRWCCRMSLLVLQLAPPYRRQGWSKSWASAPPGSSIEILVSARRKFCAGSCPGSAKERMQPLHPLQQRSIPQCVAEP